MSARPSVLRLVLVLIALPGLLTPVGCGRGSPPAQPEGQRERVVLAYSDQPLSAQVYVADAEGLFAREGLDVELRGFPSGRVALEQMLAGRADFATAAETPILFAVLDGRQLCILSTLTVTEKNIALLGRRDRGVVDAEDLRGKRIAVSPRTNSEFFLDVLLIYYGIPADAVQTVPVAPDRMVAALAAGEVDAISIWEPYLSQARRLLGTRAVTLTGQDIYLWTWNLVTTRDLARQRPETARRMLRALLAATRSLAERPRPAQALAAHRLGVDRALIAGIWDIYRFDLQLDQTLVLNLEGQTRWAIRSRYVGAAPAGTEAAAGHPELPNFLDSICPGPLSAVAPAAVQLIHEERGR